MIINDMIYTIKTKNSTYTLETVRENPDVMKIKSDNYLSGLEIIKPEEVPNVGEPFNFILANTPANGKMVGRMMNTSPVESVSMQSMASPYLVNQQTGFAARKSLSMDAVRPVRPTAQQHKVNPYPAQINDNAMYSTPNYQQVYDNGNTYGQFVPEQTTKSAPKPNTRIKNPFALAVAFAKNKLTQHFHTSHSTYTLTPVEENNNVMMLSGGVLSHPLEVEKPSVMPQTGEKLELSYTNNPSNGEYAGKRFKSSSIKEKSFTDENGNEYSEDEVRGEYKEQFDKQSKQNPSIDIATAHSTYKLSAVPGKDDIMILTGGKIPFPLEVYKPKTMPQLGEQLNLSYTSNPNNGSFANKQFCSSRIMNMTDNTHQIQNNSLSNDDNLEDAGKFKVIYATSLGKDFGSIMQTKMSDIVNRASEILGLPDEQKPEIYFAPAKIDGAKGKLSSFQVGFKGFGTGTNPNVGSALREAISDEMISAGCGTINYDGISPISKQEFGEMKNALSESSLNLDRQNMIMKAIADMEKNTAEARNELRSALSTPYISENVKSDNGMQF